MQQSALNIYVGMDVFLEPTGNAKLHRQSVGIPATISKIGRKYFYVTSEQSLWGREPKFDLTTMKCWDGDQNYGYILYPSEEAYKQEQERREKIAFLKELLNRHGDKLPYEIVSTMHDAAKHWEK